MEIHAATDLMNTGMFETELIVFQTEALVKASTPNACQVEDEVTPKMKQIKLCHA